MNPKQALQQLLAVLDQLEILYAIGGSAASSVHGEPRTTYDIDVIARLDVRDLDELLRLTGGAFYFDEETAREAFLLGRAFNLIHMATAFKFDLFPAQGDSFRESQVIRRLETTLTLPGGDVECNVISAEDCILAKLSWYRAGGGSEKQWTDLVGIIRRKAASLDRAYLQHWAKRLGVADLLDRLFTPAMLS